MSQAGFNRLVSKVIDLTNLGGLRHRVPEAPRWTKLPVVTLFVSFQNYGNIDVGDKGDNDMLVILWWWPILDVGDIVIKLATFFQRS